MFPILTCCLLYPSQSRQLHVLYKSNKLIVRERIEWKGKKRLETINIINEKLIEGIVKDVHFIEPNLFEFKVMSNNTHLLIEVSHKCSCQKRMRAGSLPSGLVAAGGDDSLVGRKLKARHLHPRRSLRYTSRARPGPRSRLQSSPQTPRPRCRGAG